MLVINYYCYNYVFNTDQSHKFQDPKFPTECFFLALHCHHIAIIPIMRKYTRQLRAIRELNRIIEDMNSAESQWAHLPIAYRNKQLVKKWKSQIKVI